MNYIRNQQKLIYPKLSYVLVGVLFEIHNELGHYARERQYQDVFELKLKEKGIGYEQEKLIPVAPNISLRNNRVDFYIEGKILMEFKTKRVLEKEDYYQIKRYLEAAGISLGILVNFRTKYLNPKRILNAKTLSAD